MLLCSFNLPLKTVKTAIRFFTYKRAFYTDCSLGLVIMFSQALLLTFQSVKAASHRIRLRLTIWLMANGSLHTGCVKPPLRLHK